jgi:ERCC4-type nuclease
MAIVCDDRKEDSTYYGLMNKGIVDIEKERIEIADIILDDGYAIERKGHDLIQSLTSGRIWDQLNNLCQYSHPILCIVNENIWRDFYYCRSNWIHNSYKGFLTTLTVSYPKLKVFHFQSMEEYIDYIIALDKKIHKEGKSSRPVPMARRAKTPEEIKENILSMIPGLGIPKTKLLLKEFDSIYNICSVTAKDLQEVNGIGKKLADVIYKYLH